ncbi:hypothetical protein OX283_004190 [Flavobacterium sp. SUN052]|uniref:hypothetical protein n=1 Tax=Flavobacterium sp. SUN052 TaxID=3002441 RepID=UPI00237DE8C3|nr:hypothetical protein [Flavobacterium sp. SUN052]MEC4003845.1 hypothetical protein [Flavobacterium sp. SUN052]
MKRIIVLLFLVLYSNCFSQDNEISIALKDSDTNLPIIDATVYVVKTKQLFLSNSDGIVTFVLTGISNIQISHTSYTTTIIRSSTLKEKVNLVVLKSTINNLDEIVITKQHPQKILKSVVENSVKKLTVPARLKVYSREFFKLNGLYSNYNDGLLNFQINGKDKDFKADILVEQNRSFGLVDENINNDLVGYNLNDIMQNYYNFKYLNVILDPKTKKIYDFLIKSSTTNADYYIMLVTPLDDAKGLLDDFTIVYDKKKKLIIEVNSSVSPSIIAKAKDKTSIGSKNIYKSMFKTIYRNDDSNYYLISSKEEIGFERIDKKGVTNIEVRNYFVTTNFSNQNYTFKENEAFKDKTLFNKKNKILTDYWNTSGLTATDEELQIIKDIEQEH